MTAIEQDWFMYKTGLQVLLAKQMKDTVFFMMKSISKIALTVNGKKNNIHRKDFLTLAEHCDIPKKAAERMIEQIISRKDKMISICEESLLSKDQKQKMIQLINARMDMLQTHDQTFS